VGAAVNAKGKKMLEVDAATGTLTIPIWAAGAVSAVLLALVVLAIGRAGVATSINVLFRVAVVAIALSAGWLYIQRMDRQEHTAEIRSLDERSAALLARAVAPGSALSCLDELAGETVEAACEKAVFASPETVAAAVNYVAAQLALLADRERAGHGDATFAPLLAALETDRFGIVAHVLAQHHDCTAANCGPLTWLVDPSHVLANLRDRTFDEQVAKFAAAWNSPARAARDGAATAELPHSGPASVVVSPHYDFPSSQSIPPVNIMAPEPLAPRPGATPNGQSAAPSGDGNPRPATTPVPPRRPSQGRAVGATVGSRPSTPHPAAPVAVGEAPTDGAGTRPLGSGQPQ
jgi:hypothetical protein